jgi:hypothetical protein
MLMAISDLVANYFHSWESIGNDEADRIFTSDVKYVVKSMPRNGGEKQNSIQGEIVGIDNLRQYLTRVKRRQKNFQIRFVLTDETTSSASAIFFVQFLDTDLRMRQTIFGRSLFVFSSDGLKISEYNEIHILHSKAVAIASAYDTASKTLYIFKNFFNKLSQISRLAAFGILWYTMVAVFVVSVFINFLLLTYGLGDSGAALLSFLWPRHQQVNLITQLEKEALANGLRTWLTWYLTAFSALLPLILFIRNSLVKGRAPFDSIPVVRENQEEEILADCFRNAEKVIIISGDFSFLSTNQKLCDIFIDLSKRRRLQMLSYKAMEDVKPVLNTSIRAQTLFRNATSLGQFYFNCPVQAKSSFVSYGHKSLVLYRYKSDDGSNNSFRMGFLKHHPDSDYLLYSLGKIFEQLPNLCGRSQREG